MHLVSHVHAVTAPFAQADIEFHRSVIYVEVVTPLSRTWSHPTVLTAIKDTCSVLKKNVSHVRWWPYYDDAVAMHCLLALTPTFCCRSFQIFSDVRHIL